MVLQNFPCIVNGRNTAGATDILGTLDTSNEDMGIIITISIHTSPVVVICKQKILQSIIYTQFHLAIKMFISFIYRFEILMSNDSVERIRPT